MNAYDKLNDSTQYVNKIYNNGNDQLGINIMLTLDLIFDKESIRCVQKFPAKN